MSDFSESSSKKPELARDVKPGYRMELAYLGSSYFGWQSQTHGRTVQDHVQKALSTLLRHPVQTVAASRTDSGVHAEKQVILFRTEVDFHEEKWLRSLNGLLPTDIGILGISPSPADFHPIYSSRGKIYRYRLWLGSSRNPFMAESSWRLHHKLDLSAMRKAATFFEGTHDFTSFCALDSSALTRQRTVFGIEILEKGPVVEIWVFGKGFLKQMVRIMVGTLVNIGLGKNPPEHVKELIAAKNRSLAGKTAPAQGLSLMEIFYENLPTKEEFRRSLLDPCSE